VIKIRKGLEKGASLVEYGIITGLISILAISSLASMGGKVSGVFESSAVSLDSTMANKSGPIAVDPELADFTMFAERRDGYYRGYYLHGNPTYAVGTMTVRKNSLGTITQFLYSEQSNQTFLAFSSSAGDIRSQLDGTTLNCNHGSWALNSSNLQYGSHTQAVWNWTDGPDFTPNSTYVCTIDM
jgi:Flp pilus assembly pilin Flp